MNDSNNYKDKINDYIDLAFQFTQRQSLDVALWFHTTGFHNTTNKPVLSF